MAQRRFLRFCLARLNRRLEHAEAKAKDKADALVQANERTVEALEEEWIAARERVRCIKAAIARVEDRLSRPPLLWWLTKSGVKAKQRSDGWNFGLELLKTRPPSEVLQETVGTSPFNGEAFNDGVRAAVADFEAKGEK
jgi:hypothetical protein